MQCKGMQDMLQETFCRHTVLNEKVEAALRWVLSSYAPRNAKLKGSATFSFSFWLLQIELDQALMSAEIRGLIKNHEQCDKSSQLVQEMKSPWQGKFFQISIQYFATKAENKSRRYNIYYHVYVNNLMIHQIDYGMMVARKVYVSKVQPFSKGPT